MLKKWDVLLILFICIIGATSLFPFQKNEDSHVIAVIEQEGKEIQRVNLAHVLEPYYIKLDGEYPAFIYVERDGVSFFHASCPDKLCERKGKISFVGETAVCLPGRILVRIEGQKNQVDGITG